MQTISMHDIFYLVVAMVYLEKNVSIWEAEWTLPTFLEHEDWKKSVKTLTFRVVLDSLRTVCQVFDTFSRLPGKTILRSSNFGDDKWRVGS